MVRVQLGVRVCSLCVGHGIPPNVYMYGMGYCPGLTSTQAP